MPELTRPRRLLVLAICCSSLFIVGLDVTIVNLALPAIRRDLGSSLSGLQWVIDAYTLVLASLLMLGGSTGDRIGRSSLHAGLLTLPMAVMTAVLPPISGRIVATRGARLPLLIGGAGIAASGVLLLTLDVDTPLALVVAAYIVFGIGFGMVNAPITNTAVSGMPMAQAGVAAGVASTSRQVGSALGVAVLGSLVTAQLGPVATGFAAAVRPAWVVIGCGLVVLALGVASTTAWARETARRTSERFAVAVPAAAMQA